MRLRLSLILIGSLMLSGCGKSGDDSPTTQQAAQLETLRQAAIAQLQTMLRRPLTEDEKQCVVVRLESGKLRSYVTSSLSDTLKEWHRQPSSTQP